MFKNGIFLLVYEEEEEEEEEEQQTRYEKEESNIRNENGLIDYKNLRD